MKLDYELFRSLQKDRRFRVNNDIRNFITAIDYIKYKKNIRRTPLIEFLLLSIPFKIVHITDNKYVLANRYTRDLGCHNFNSPTINDGLSICMYKSRLFKIKNDSKLRNDKYNKNILNFNTTNNILYERSSIYHLNDNDFFEHVNNILEFILYDISPLYNGKKSNRKTLNP